MNIDFPGALPRWTQNYAARPPGYKIDLCVLHATSGPQPQDQQVSGTIAWFQNPDSQVSAHYLIGLQGDVYQFVPEILAAWHANAAGLPDFNSHSIGVELAQQAGHSDYANPQLAALINLLAWLVGRYHLTQAQIVTHASLNPQKTDPLEWGAYNSRIMAAVFDPQAPHGQAQPAPVPPVLRWDKICWYLEQAMRNMEFEGWKAESEQIGKTYLADAIGKRDAK